MNRWSKFIYQPKDGATSLQVAYMWYAASAIPANFIANETHHICRQQMCALAPKKKYNKSLALYVSPHQVQHQLAENNNIWLNSSLWVNKDTRKRKW